MINYFIILPSLKVSGGVMEAYNLAEKLNNEKSRCSIVCLWKTNTPISTRNIVTHQICNWKTDIRFAIFQLPIILFRFYFFAKKLPKSSKLIFTHYSTVPLIKASPHHSEKKIFVQGIEWEFIKIPFISSIFSKTLLKAYKNNDIISANEYIHKRLLKKGIESKPFPLWADKFYLSEKNNHNKNNDFLMIIRKGFIKRPDLYFDFIKNEKIKNKYKLKAITPELEIHIKLKEMGIESFLSPTKEKIKKLYEESKIFIFLSENEGFGLPPTEAMGSGCIPICRNSGGPTAYMTGPLKELLFPLESSMQSIIEKSEFLLENRSYYKIIQEYCIILFKNKIEFIKNFDYQKSI